MDMPPFIHSLIKEQGSYFQFGTELSHYAEKKKSELNLRQAEGRK